MYTEDFTGKEAWRMHLSNGSKINYLLMRERDKMNIIGESVQGIGEEFLILFSQLFSKFEIISK